MHYHDNLMSERLPLPHAVAVHQFRVGDMGRAGSLIAFGSLAFIPVRSTISREANV
jgi:hypothetical protein